MSQNLNSAQITEFVCTRISHDLIGNIGAVCNAVELMEDQEPETLSEIKPILDISSQALSARMKFFRLAFGLSNAAPQDVEQIRRITADYIKTIGSRQTPIEVRMTLKTPMLYKIVLSGVMALADVFIRGGLLQVIESEDGLSIKAASSAPLSVAKLETMQKVLEGKIPEENPAQTAPLLYLQSLLASRPVQIRLHYSQTEADLQIG